MKLDDLPAFQRLLYVEEDRLLKATRRLFAFEAFVEELKLVTRGKSFEIRSDVLGMAMIDSRDLHVILLASWAKKFYSHGRFLGQVQAHHLRDLPRPRAARRASPRVNRTAKRRVTLSRPGRI